MIDPFKIISYTGFSHMSLKTIGKVQCHNFQSHINSRKKMRGQFRKREVCVVSNLPLFFRGMQYYLRNKNYFALSRIKIMAKTDTFQFTKRCISKYQ